jgi:fermentation-respiration switch protein FrsA (DUF1100 family)
MPQLSGVPKLLFHSLDDPIVPLSNGIRLYQAAPAPRVFATDPRRPCADLCRQTWQTVMLRYLDDPQHFNGLRRLGEIPNYPIPKVDSSESPQ